MAAQREVAKIKRHVRRDRDAGLHAPFYNYNIAGEYMRIALLASGSEWDLPSMLELQSYWQNSEL